MRNAFVKARRRTACRAHCSSGCSHAPRPGRLLAGSTITAYSPFPADTATTRSSLTANSRFRHPTHVRTGLPVTRCAETEGSRWITAQSKACRPTPVNRSSPPFSGIVGSHSGRGMNVGSRVNRAGFTGTRRVLVSAVPSAGIGGPAPLLGGPGVWRGTVMSLAPAGQIHRRVGVAVGRMSALASKHSISQGQIAADGTAGRAEPA